MNAPRMEVSHTSTDVTITVSSDLARDIAFVWSHAHATNPELGDQHPQWHADVIALLSHAVMSDQAAGAGPIPIDAVLLPHPPLADRPRLEAVSS